MPPALIFCIPIQKTLSIFKDCSCVLILPGAAVNQTYLFRKRAKSGCVWRIARPFKQQAMHCGELESAGPYLAAKMLKLGVPYTWNDLWSTECYWPESWRKVLMRFKWAGSISNHIHILLSGACACLRLFAMEMQRRHGVVVSTSFINTKAGEKDEDTRWGWEEINLERWWARGRRRRSRALRPSIHPECKASGFQWLNERTPFKNRDLIN